MKLRWTNYDWHFCIDNGSDENVELVINNRSCSVPAKSFDNFYQDFHCPSISIDCKGQNYHFETPGRYVFNIDALNSYYVIEHEVHTRFSFAADGFTLTDSITDTIRNRMFFHEPHGIDKWFEYPQRISIRATKDKTEWDIPKVIRSIQRISEYEEYKRNEQEMYEE
ncbi:hypothetical protein AGMMS49574_03740 [Bacteroidia bacterium]|nr:hypothetical protein AGMMS49574_03740 [Bacteroidia bacterium]